MYIKRKVFSVYEDEYGEERYFSTTEYVNEEDYLDEREFAEKEKGKGLTKAQKAAIITSASVLGAAGLTYGGAKLTPKVTKQIEKFLGKKYYKEGVSRTAEEANNYIKNINKLGRVNKGAEKVSEAMEKPFRYVGETAKKIFKKNK